MHELLEARLKGVQVDLPESESAIELECRRMFAAYINAYPVECFVPLSVERVFSVPIPGTEHIYTGKFDAIVRYTEAEPLFAGKLAILEHKTEKRSSNRNLPEAWAARSQVSLYKFAAETLYNEPVAHIILDVLRRPSPKGQEPAVFYRDLLERTEEQVTDALNDLVYVADQIEWLEKKWDTERWPRNTENCVINRWKCDYFDVHVGVPDQNLVQLKYKPTDEYLPGL